MAAKAKDNDSHPESLPTVNRLTPHAGFFQSPPVIAAGADSFLAISFCFLRPIPPHVRGLLYGDFAFRASLKVLAEEGMGKETRAKLIWYVLTMHLDVRSLMTYEVIAAGRVI